MAPALSARPNFFTKGPQKKWNIEYESRKPDISMPTGWRSCKNCLLDMTTEMAILSSCSIRVMSSNGTPIYYHLRFNDLLFATVFTATPEDRSAIF